jgi:hypothetical protein
MEDKNIVGLLYFHDEHGLVFTKEKYNLLLENSLFGILRNRDDFNFMNYLISIVSKKIIKWICQKNI